MKTCIYTTLLLGLLAGMANAGEGSSGTAARVEYTLKTTRSRDPVLGGARDKVFVSVWIPAGVKTVRGALYLPLPASHLGLHGPTPDERIDVRISMSGTTQLGPAPKK